MQQRKRTQKNKYVAVTIMTVAVCLLLFFILLFKHRIHNNDSIVFTSPAIAKTAVLSLIKQTNTTYAVMIDANKTPVSAVQLEIGYDPFVLTNIMITPGDFFSAPLLLAYTIDATNRRLFYAVAKQPGQQSKSGKGVIATLSFTLHPGITSTPLTFLPLTKVTTEGIDNSILKQATGITVQ